jgi:hypothetical protein
MYLLGTLTCYLYHLFLSPFSPPPLRLTPPLLSLLSLFYLTRYLSLPLLSTLSFSLCLTLHARLVNTFTALIDQMKDEQVSNLSQWVAQAARVVGVMMFSVSGGISYWREVPREVEMFVTMIWMMISAWAVWVGEGWVRKRKEGDRIVNSDKYY